MTNLANPEEVHLMQTDLCTYILSAQPKATLLYATPEWVVAQATKGYTGHFSTEALTPEEHELFWWELGATKLKGPMEMANTFWLLEDVTRGMTHQLARYRLGTSMVQESQRFSKQTGSLARIVIPTNIVNNSNAMEEFVDGCEAAMTAYFTMLEADGVETQDARSLLPTGICTRLYLNVSVLSLAHIYEQRHCCQAQSEEWGPIVKQFKEELTLKDFPHYADSLKAPWENPTCVSCGFGASFDRPCKNAPKFAQNLSNMYWESKL